MKVRMNGYRGACLCMEVSILCVCLSQVPGNKMTALNLATVLGPNILHKQKSSEKEFSVQSSARAEESAAVISVVQRLITAQEALFMVGWR